MTLEEVSLPSESDWQAAGERAKAIFGIPASPLLNATNVNALSEAIRGKVKEWVSPAHSLIGRLESLQASRLPDGTCTRLETAREALSLLKTLEGTSGNSLIGKLASFSLVAKPAVLGVALSSCSRLDQALDVADWEIFDGIRALTDDRKESADQIWADLQDAFNSDEYAVALVPKLERVAPAGGEIADHGAAITPEPAASNSPRTAEPPEPPTRTATELKTLYGSSQVKGDELPPWLSAEGKA